MVNNIIREKIFKAAKNAFYKNTQLHLNIKQNEYAKKHAGTIIKFDKLIELKFNEKTILFYAEIKKTLLSDIPMGVIIKLVLLV